MSLGLEEDQQGHSLLKDLYGAAGQVNLKRGLIEKGSD